MRNIFLALFLLIIGVLASQEANASCICYCENTRSDASFSRGEVADESACQQTCQRESGTDLVRMLKCEVVAGTEKPEEKPPEAPPSVVALGTNPLCPAKGPCTISFLIGRVIQVALGLVGTIALVMFVYGGFLWMTAGGKSERIEKAKNVLVWSSLGLVAIFASYIVVRFIIEQVVPK